MLRTSGLVLGLLLIGLVGWQLLAPPRFRPFRTTVCALGEWQLEVTGQLVDDETGLPLAGRGVLAAEFDRGVDDARTAQVLAALSESARTGAPAPTQDLERDLRLWLHGPSHALSDDAGRFRLRVRRTHCVCYVQGETPDDTPPSERVGVECLLVERMGGPPAPFRPPPSGTWTTHPRPSHATDPRATWDLGVLRVRAAGR